MPFKMESMEVPNESLAIASLTVSGKLTREDYDLFVPEFEGLLESNDRLRMMTVLTDFEGWTTGALWEDLKTGIKHIRDLNKFERMAVVGNRSWEKVAAQLARPFTSADVKFFELDKVGEARKWIQEPSQEILH